VIDVEAIWAATQQRIAWSLSEQGLVNPKETARSCVVVSVPYIRRAALLEAAEILGQPVQGGLVTTEQVKKALIGLANQADDTRGDGQ
jgi:hypothetical protein